MELYGTVGVSLDFVVNSDKLPEKLPDEKLPEDDTVHLRARLTGKDLKTKIRSRFIANWISVYAGNYSRAPLL